MAGLSLMAGGGVVGALPPSQAAGTQTITQQAYGVGSGADVAGKKVAGLGTAAGAVMGTAILAWLWWTLPH
jgi:hypothetical protein